MDMSDLKIDMNDMIMTDSPIRFPGLFGDWTFTASSKAIDVGHGIYWYGILIALGLLLALLLCMKERVKYGISEDNLYDGLLWGIPIGIVGARVYYVLFYLDRFHTSDGKFDFGSAIAFWDGGLAIYGTVIAVIILAVCLSRRKGKRGFKFFAMTDLVVMGLLVGQIVGRWGNFMNREAFGSETTCLFRMQLTTKAGQLIEVHPTFLYESIWCFVGLALLAAYIKKRKFNGDIALRYLIWYGAGRFWIESLRTDSLLLVPSLGLRASQLVAAAAVVGGVALEIFLTRKYKSKPLMVTLALTAENRSLLAKVRKAEPEFTVEREELMASSPRKLFLERTNAYNERVKQQLKEKLAEKN